MGLVELVRHRVEDYDAGAILGAVAAAGATHEATVLVREAVLPDGPDFHRAKTLDAMILALTGGRERTLDQYDALLAKAGLTMTQVTPTATEFSVVEATVRSA